MIFRFLLLSDEVDSFKREIQIDSDATFLDLHNAILDSVNYRQGDMASFFICDDDWSKQLEITFVEMDTDWDQDSYVMSESVLGDLLEDEKQKMIYIFDYLSERAFFMELSEIIPGKHLARAVCSGSQGNPPEQFIETENIEVDKGILSSDENFYGDESFDMSELDADGFEGLDDDAPVSPDEQEFS